MNPYLGEVRLVPFNFPPLGWAFCQGQLIAISQNTALFSLLGTFYGGDGRSTFGLPNLQGAVIIGQGQSPGLSLYELGEIGGTSSVTLLTSEMPAHSHNIPASAAASHGGVPGPSVALGSGGRGSQDLYVNASAQQTSPVTMAGNVCGTAGGSQPHNNLMPYLVLSYVIALQGIFPARS